MLTHLRVVDYALLDDVSLDLGPGLNVLTGETGAGKSLLVHAVSLLRGGRASAEVVRTGAEEARIEAVFEPEGSAARALAERLARAGLEAAEVGGDAGESLVVRRTIAGGGAGGAAGGLAAASATAIPTAAAGGATVAGGRSGRGRVYVNGALSTAAVLGELAGDLIDLAGQHEHQKLMDPAQHLALLDSFGLDGHGIGRPALDEMAAAATALGAAAEALRALSLDERARAAREDFLRFQVREIDEASLRAGEDAALRQERERLRGAEKLHAAARGAEQALYARENAVVDQLATVVRELEEAARVDPALRRLAAQVEEARVTLDDAADALRHYADGMQADPERLQEVEERLHLLGKLLRKHADAAGQADVETVLTKRDAMAAELAALGSHEERRAEAERALAAARARAERAAEALRAARGRAAEALAARASTELQALGLAGAQLLVELGDRAAREGDDPALVVARRRLGPTGFDRAEFLLCANPGEEPRPLHRVASGGELSRIMLALKRVLARADVVSTYVFDEVDAGIGGAVADVVGRQLKQVAGEKQVLCVTHLPQIAAYADVHFHVEKRTLDGRTRTVVRRLGSEDRVEELARMVGGARVTPKARAHAEELIRHARAAAEQSGRG